MRYRIWIVVEGRRFAAGWTDSKRDALATVRTIPESSFEDTASEE